MRKFLIKVNGNQYDVEVEEVKTADNNAPAASVETKKEASLPATETKSTEIAGLKKVTSPMPGTILKVKVAKGDLVKKGQVLLILEAMKMENEIVSPSDGKVSSVNVSGHSSVNAGDLLVSIE